MTEIKKIDEQLTQSIDDFIGKLVVEMAQTPAFNRIAKSILNRAIQQWSKGKLRSAGNNVHQLAHDASLFS